MKLLEKQKALAWRRMGQSYREIQEKLQVSKSTLNVWLRDIQLSPVQIIRLLDKKAQGAYRGAQQRRSMRLRKTNEIYKQAYREFDRLLKNRLFLSGLMLYWAEGDKHKKEMVKFTNSDPAMIVFMMKWFRDICDIAETKFRILIHMHNLQIRPDIMNFWSRITGVPLHQFHKAYVKQTSLGHRKNALYNGTCAIRINNVNLFRRIMGWKQAMMKHFNISP